MAKYFMGGARLENLERLMMDPSRSKHSPPPDSQRQKGRRPQTGLPDKSLERNGGEDKCNA